MHSEPVVITGASSGIGLEIARYFARCGHALFITAPVESEIRKVAHALRHEGGDVSYLASDRGMRPNDYGPHLLPKIAVHA